MLRVARFLAGYVRYPYRPLREQEVVLSHEGTDLPATFVRPRSRGPLPGWILLHGITVPGRHHPVLSRFANAVASSGAAVIVPEVPAWRDLRLDPLAGDRSILAAIAHLRERPDVRGDLNLMGFSFGATQALMSAAKPGIREHVRGVVGFGGYCDLGHTMRFMMTGEHEWMGVRRRIEPDPYGRWIVAANFIDAVPACAEMVTLKQAARDLAAEAGRRGVYAAEESYDPLKRELRDRLSAEERQIWDIIAPPSGHHPPLDRSRALAADLHLAASRRSPELDPRPWLPLLDETKIALAHGLDDTLIPFTETRRLTAALSGHPRVTASVTRLFTHSREAEPLRFYEYPREFGRYLGLLRRALRPS